MIPATDAAATLRAELRRALRPSSCDDAGEWTAHLQREAEWQRGPVYQSLADRRAAAQPEGVITDERSRPAEAREGRLAGEEHERHTTFVAARDRGRGRFRLGRFDVRRRRSVDAAVDGRSLSGVVLADTERHGRGSGFRHRVARARQARLTGRACQPEVSERKRIMGVEITRASWWRGASQQATAVPKVTAVPNAVAERVHAPIDQRSPSTDAVSRGDGDAGSASADGLSAEVALPELRILDALKAVQVSAEARRDVERVARVRAGRRALVSCSSRAHAAANNALIDLQTGAGDITELAELVADLAARHSSLDAALTMYPAHSQVAPESVVEAVHQAVGVMVGAVPDVATPFAVEVEARWSDQAQRAKAGVQVVPLARTDLEQAVAQGWREWRDALAPVDAQVRALQRQASAVQGADVDVALNLLAAVDSTVSEQIPPLVGKAKSMRRLAALADEQRQQRDDAERLATR